MATAARMPMMATTIINSMSVKPFCPDSIPVSPCKVRCVKSVLRQTTHAAFGPAYCRRRNAPDPALSRPFASQNDAARRNCFPRDRLSLPAAGGLSACPCFITHHHHDHNDNTAMDHHSSPLSGLTQRLVRQGYLSQAAARQALRQAQDGQGSL